MPSDLTSYHIARAVAGDPASHTFLVDHFGPMLLAQARYRLRGELRARCEPEDLVQELWLTVLPRLPDLQARDGRWTPVLLRFLATTLLRKVHHLLRKQIAAPLAEAATHDADDSEAPVRPSPHTGVVTHANRSEVASAMHAAIATLDDEERELLVLRGIEQMSNVEIARKLQIPEYEATRRYQRSLAHLRRELPGSVFAELVDV